MCTCTSFGQVLFLSTPGRVGGILCRCRRKEWQVPETQGEGERQLVPMYAGAKLQWQVDQRYQ